MSRQGAALLLSLLALCSAAPAPAQNLLLTLASEPPAAGMASTRDLQRLSLTVMPGATVTVARAEGRDYRLRPGSGWVWTQVEEVPMDADSVALTPALREDGSIEVAVAVARKEGTRQQRYTSTVFAVPGEWVQLLGAAPMQPRDTRVYGTRELAGETLYLRVVLAGDSPGD